MTDTYNDALSEQLRKNVWDTLQSEAKNMSPLDYASTVADITGVFDPTPLSDGAGFLLSAAQGDALGAALSLGSMIPYAGDALAKPLKFAKKAPLTGKALEALFHAGDNLAMAGQAALKRSGLGLEQVAAARKQALAKVQQAMLDVKVRRAGCVECRLVGAKGQNRSLHMPHTGSNGKWKNPKGEQPMDGNGVFEFHESRKLPDGRTVKEIEFRDGTPVYDNYVEGQRYDLWEVSGNAKKDGDELTKMKRESDPNWKPPSKDEFVLHHFEDGKVGYIPRAIHDTRYKGVAHTGGNSMTNNELF
ncbi:MAG: hypothetical protein ACOYMG_02365 [Candidatus Methylumidiphilus sp.]